MAYEYVKSFYGVNPEPGMRVTMKDSGKMGTVARKRSYDNYVHVRFDGSKFDAPCHPMDLIYPKDLTEALEDVRSHLAVALVQALPSDDQIIMQHVKDAHAIVVAALAGKKVGA